MNHHYQMSVSQASGSGDLCGSPVNVTAPVTSSATTDVTAGGNDQQIQLLIGLNGYHHQSYHQGEMAADGTMMSMDDGSGYHLNQMPTDDTNQPYAIYQVQYQDLPQGQPMSTGAYDDWNKNLDYGESQAAQMVVQQSPQPVQTTDQSQMWVPAGQVDNYHQMVSAATHQQQQMNMNMMPTVSTVSSGTITIPPVQPSQHQMYTTIAYQNQGGQIVINNHQPATETPQQQVIQQQQIQPQQIIQQQQQPLTKQTQVQQQQAKPSPLPKAKKSQPKQPPKPKAVKATKSKPENEEGGGAVVEKVTKGKKKTKKKDETGEGKAESKPKTKEKTKPVSAYALFFRDTQAAIKTEHPKAAFGEISKIVASKWEVLEKDQKDIYKERADQEKKIYLHNLASSKAKEVAEQNAMQQQNQAAQEGAVQPAQPQLSPVPQQVQSAQLDQLHHQQQQQQQQQQQLPPSDPSASNQYMTHHAHPNPAYQSTSQAQQQSELSLMLMGQTNNGLSLNETSSESGFGSLSHLNYGDAGGYQPAGQPPQPGLDVMDGQSSSDATFNPYDSSFFDSQLATSNLMDFDLNEFDDINLLPTGGPFSPSTTGVFDPTIVANDYLSDFENNTSDSFGLGIATDEVSICQAAEDLMNLGPPPPYPTIEPNKPTDQRMMVKMEPTDELGSNVDMNHANGIVTPSCEVTNHVTDTIKVEEEEAKPMVCMRKGCGRLGVHSPQWDGEFCSEQCCVLFSKDAFQSWIAEHRVRTSTQPEMDSKTALNSLVTCLTTPSL